MKITASNPIIVSQSITMSMEITGDYTRTITATADTKDQCIAELKTLVEEAHREMVKEFNSRDRHQIMVNRVKENSKKVLDKAIKAQAKAAKAKGSGQIRKASNYNLAPVASSVNPGRYRVVNGVVEFS